MHISFVRSVMMDSFKVSEVKRMETGGNKAWRDFWNKHEEGGNGDAVVWDKTDLRDRYNGFVGEEYKERLGCKVEGRDYVPIKRETKKPAPSASSQSGTPAGGSRSGTPAVRTGRPAVGAPGSQKTKNEAYFAKMGAENANRPDGVAPNQGGKYGGFGSSYDSNPGAKKEDALPTADDFQKDPVAALTKGFGWFTSAASKAAKNVNDSYLQPGMDNIAKSDFASQAKTHATFIGSTVARGAQGVGSKASEGLTRFVEGDEYAKTHTRLGAEPERKDFWDDFGGAAEQRQEPAKKDFWDSFGAGDDGAGGSTSGGLGRTDSAKKSGAIGTAAMKKPANGPPAASGEKDGEWDKDW